MTLKFTNKIDSMMLNTRDEVVKQQHEKAKLLNEVDNLRKETEFLEGVRTRVASVLLTEKTWELQNMELSVEEYATLTLLVPNLKEQEWKIRNIISNLQTDVVKLSGEKNALESNIVNIGRQVMKDRFHY